MDVIVAYTADNNRKRKFETELLGPFPKHVRGVEGIGYNILPNLGKELNVDIKIIATGSESDPGSVKDSSNSVHADADSDMLEQDEVVVVGYPKSYTSDDHSASSSGLNGGASSEINPYSLESRSLTRSSCSKSESVPISEDHEYSCHEDCCCSEYVNDDEEYSMDKELESFINSSGVASSDFILSSGRWSVNQAQDTEQKAVKLTIDKEFEQYFSTLML